MYSHGHRAHPLIESAPRWCAALLLLLGPGCNSSLVSGAADGGVPQPDTAPAVCNGGTDGDGDGHGEGCPAGPDCDDADPSAFAGALERCDGRDNNCDGTVDEGLRNACGTCDATCKVWGSGGPFQLNPAEEPTLARVDGLGLDPSGDVVLQSSERETSHLWIANDLDWRRGTVSKVDTINLKEAARYFTVTCLSRGPVAAGAPCLDLHGRPIVQDWHHRPSRTAVDNRSDVWVANRAHAKPCTRDSDCLSGRCSATRSCEGSDDFGQPSATKIANSLADCRDRNGVPGLQTSRDRDGDGVITVDCDANGQPDDARTVCTRTGQNGALEGGAPEFYGYDDDCVLFTVNFAEARDVGRSVCLDGGAPSNAWVGTNAHRSPSGVATNRFYRVDGESGALTGPFELPAGHAPYGCAIDRAGILWSVGSDVSLAYLDTRAPTQRGYRVVPPNDPAQPTTASGFYGIALDPQQQVWLGGSRSGRVYRYRPDRTTFDTLPSGHWTLVRHPERFVDAAGRVITTELITRGIAPDHRGKVWVAVNPGFIWRIDAATLPDDPVVDLSQSTHYWPTVGAGLGGVGIDRQGHVWGISGSASAACRLDVDGRGEVVAGVPSMTDAARQVKVGQSPYTYSDFTGFGLQRITQPQGSLAYRLEPCAEGTTRGVRWGRVSWTAVTPGGTSLRLRVRAIDKAGVAGAWLTPASSPLELTAESGPLFAAPSRALELEFVLRADETGNSPALRDFDVTFSCVADVY